MNKILIIIFLEIFMLIYLPLFAQIHELQVRNFSEIPKELLHNLDKMGMDTSSVLNEYEGKYLNFIFKIDPLVFNLVGKKIGFIGSKTDYFKDTRSPERFSTTVGGSGLYIFNAEQKKASGGYDAAITYWSKRLIPIEEVLDILKSKNTKKEVRNGGDT